MTDSPQWYDDEAGPIVRLYAITAGRARPAGETFDLMTVVYGSTTPLDGQTLTPEQSSILRLCREGPQPVADIAAECDLPVSVIRVLLSDLLRFGCIRVSPPVPPAELPDVRILREVINGLRAL
ncbi:DUF742 domain-containing protein [Streptomyces sp. NPDC020801]|uniref:DUF742 domain-containing protein n=1 Tax=Streptomyces sp. NPDC020801 TaxID=3365093 RepID=UPI0037949912